MSDESGRNFDPSERRRPRRLEETSTAEIRFPLVWIVVGGLAALIVVGLVGLGVVNFVRQGAITPTPKVLSPLTKPLETPTVTGGASVAVEATDQATPSPAALEETTSTLEADAPAPSAASSGEIAIDDYVTVSGTGGVGLSLRAGPGRNNARLGIAEEGDDVRLLVLDGPKEDESQEDYVWWFVRHPDGSEGWVVEDFLVPTEGP